MTLILKNITKLFEPNYNSLDAKLWIQKLILKKYLKNKQLSAEIIGRGGAWLDTGSIEDFYETTNFVSTMENRQGFKIACLEEISLLNKWITKKHIKKQINFYGNCQYSNYLKKL